MMLNSPFGERGMWLKGHSLGARILQDWNLSTSVTARSGTPFTARVLGEYRTPGERVRLGAGERTRGQGMQVDDGVRILDTASFTVPPADRFGNAGRNTIVSSGSIILSATSWPIVHAVRPKAAGVSGQLR